MMRLMEQGKLDLQAHVFGIICRNFVCLMKIRSQARVTVLAFADAHGLAGRGTSSRIPAITVMTRWTKYVAQHGRRLSSSRQWGRTFSYNNAAFCRRRADY